MGSYIYRHLTTTDLMVALCPLSRMISCNVPYNFFIQKEMDRHPLSPADLAASSVPGPEITIGHSRYVQMLLDVDHMPWIYNVIASVAQWILLAGYLVVPGTFTSLQRSNKIEQALGDNGTGTAILGTIQNPPLLAIACVLFTIGAALLAWLYWEWRENYIWLVSRIFMCENQLLSVLH